MLGSRLINQIQYENVMKLDRTWYHSINKPQSFLTDWSLISGGNSTDCEHVSEVTEYVSV